MHNDGRTYGRTYRRFTWYVIHLGRTQRMKFDENEFYDIRWLPFAEAPLHRSDPHLGRFIKKLCANRALTGHGPNEHSYSNIGTKNVLS